MNSVIGSSYLGHLFREDAPDSAGKDDAYFDYGPILVPLTVAYVALTIALTAVFSHAKKHQYCEAINKNSNSKRTGDRIFLVYFIFL